MSGGALFSSRLRRGADVSLLAVFRVNKCPFSYFFYFFFSCFFLFPFFFLRVLVQRSSQWAISQRVFVFSLFSDHCAIRYATRTSTKKTRRPGKVREGVKACSTAILLTPSPQNVEARWICWRQQGKEVRRCLWHDSRVRTPRAPRVVHRRRKRERERERERERGGDAVELCSPAGSFIDDKSILRGDIAPRESVRGIARRPQQNNTGGLSVSET